MNQPLAYVHPEAKIANNVVIEPFVNIEKNVHIGRGSWIGSNVTIMEGARIGENCRIFPGAVISAIPQDLKFQGEDSLVRIGNNTTIREFVTVNRGTKANQETSVGNNCLLMAYTHIAHDCIIADNVVLANGATLAGHIEVGEFAIIGGHSAIHQFVKVGAHVMLSGGSLVSKDIPPFVKAARSPLSYAGINSIGLRRRGFDNDKIREIQEIYRIIFQRQMNVTQAVSIVETEMPVTQERDLILTFIANGNRGLMKGFTSIYSK